MLECVFADQECCCYAAKHALLTPESTTLSLVSLALAVHASTWLKTGCIAISLAMLLPVAVSQWESVTCCLPFVWSLQWPAQRAICQQLIPPSTVRTAVPAIKDAGKWKILSIYPLCKGCGETVFKCDMLSYVNWLQGQLLATSFRTCYVTWLCNMLFNNDNMFCTTILL